MPIVSRTQFQSTTDTLYLDNTTGQISPADLRAQMDNIADSTMFRRIGFMSAPTANDDSNGNGGNGEFNVGDIWIDETNNRSWICLDDTALAAQWYLFGGEMVVTSFTGTAVADQIAIWASPSEIRGDTGLTWDGATFAVDGDVTFTGTVNGISLDGPDIVSLLDTELGGTSWQSGGGVVPVEDDGVQIVAVPGAINFTGAGVTVTDAAGVATVDIPFDGTVDVVSNIDTGTILGRTTAGNGDSEELTPTQVRALLNIEDAAAADQTGAEIEALLDAELGGTAWKTGGGSVPAQDDGVEVVATPTALNFTGAGVTVTDVGGVATIDVPGGGGGSAVALGDLTDVDASDTTAYHILTRLPDNTFAMRAPDSNIPDGNATSWDTYTGAFSGNSSSAFATKGIIATMNVDRFLTGVTFECDAPTTQEVSLVVAELSEVNPGTITNILLPIAQVAATNPFNGVAFTLPTPVLLEAGNIYGIMFVRTDGTPTSPLALSFPGGVSPDADPNGYFTYNDEIRYASANPQVGDTVYYNGTGPVNMTIQTEGVQALASGGINFLTDATDFPAGYTGSGGRVLKVNSAEDAVEFVVDPLPDPAPADADKIIKVNGAGDGYVLENPTSAVTTQDDGVEINAAATTLNFTGNGVTVTDAGSNVSTVNIPTQVVTDIANNWAVSWRGATAVLTADDTAVDLSSGVTLYDWDTIDNDTDSFWSAGQPSRLTVPNGLGIAKVRLHAFVDVNSDLTTSDDIYVTFRKNGSGNFIGSGQIGHSVGFNNTISSIHTGAIEVTDGDYFEVQIQCGGVTNATIGSARSYFQLEVVELANATNRVFDIPVFVSGTPTASQTVLQHVMTRPANLFAGGGQSQAVANVAATAQTDFDITKNGVSIGTLSFAAAATTGTFTVASQTSFVAGDTIAVVAPGSPDATLADISITLDLNLF